MNVLIAYEDAYHAAFDVAVRRARPKAVARQLVHHAVEGVDAFPGFVERDWPRFRDVGFPIPGKPKPERLVCVADADVVVAHRGLAISPGLARGSDAWLDAVDAAFTAQLRGQLAQNPDEVHGIAVRWSYESLVIASVGVDPALSRLAGLNGQVDPKKLSDFLGQCKPDPRTTTDFSVFGNPQGCLEQLARNQGWKLFKKGDDRKDQAVEELSRNHLPLLLQRVPDLQRIGALLNRL